MQRDIRPTREGAAHDECDVEDGFRGGSLLWRRPTSLGRSESLGVVGGVRGGQVRRARRRRFGEVVQTGGHGRLPCHVLA